MMMVKCKDINLGFPFLLFYREKHYSYSTQCNNN